MLDLATVNSYVQSHRRSLTSLAFIGTVGLGIVLLASLLLLTGNADFPSSWQYPLEGDINDFSDWFIATFDWFFGPIGDGIKYLFDKLNDFLSWIPWPVVLAGVVLIIRGVAGTRVSLIAVGGLSYMGLMGLWDNSMTTLSLMGVSVLICGAIGVPVGILASRSNAFESTLRPFLDAAQTIPVFIYLVPVILLFGIGNVAAIIAIVTYSTPPVIRMTNLGIRQVSPEVLETARSFGCTSWQTLTKVQLPLAIPSILLGINQAIMFALISAVFAGLIGAGGLGREVVDGLRRLDMGKALEAGLAIVFIAIVFDRIGYAISERSRGASFPGGSGLGSLPMGMQRFQAARWVAGILILASDIPRRVSQTFATGLGVIIDSVTGALSRGGKVASVQPLFSRHPFLIISVAVLLVFVAINNLVEFGEFPAPWRLAMQGPVDSAVDWMTINLAFITERIRQYSFEYGLGPVRDFLNWLPWPVFILSVSFLARATAGLSLGLVAIVGFSYIAVVGMWDPTMTTLSMLIVAVAICMAVGIPLGILMSRNDSAQAIMKPILDTMQTMPSLVYLIPVVMLFEVGVTAALIATLIQATPPIIRLTNLGIRQVPTEAVETAQSYGCTSLQTLLKVQLPMAVPSIMMGINQTIMIAVAMMIYASLVGATGLGVEVLWAVVKINIGRGVNAGISLVVMAVVLDRMAQAWSRSRRVALGLE